jgi:hypothetical protein
MTSSSSAIESYTATSDWMARGGRKKSAKYSSGDKTTIFTTSSTTTSEIPGANNWLEYGLIAAFPAFSTVHFH